MSDFDLYESEIEELYRPKEEPKVVLTVEEAKKWMNILHENAPYLDCLYESSKDDYLFLQEISNRIEQAKAIKIGNDYNKAVNNVITEFQKQAEKVDESH